MERTCYQKRTKKGFTIYVNSMEKSTDDKTEKIIPLVRKTLKSYPGDILDFGAGGGDLSQILLDTAREFDVNLTLIDIDPRMIEILKKRFSNQERINVILGDILDFKLHNRFAVVICSSLLHEIFSKKEDFADIKQALGNIRNHLLPQGTLIIRDGVKPTPKNKTVLLKPLKSDIFKKFQKFITSYQYLKTLPYLVKVWVRSSVLVSQVIDSIENLDNETFIAVTKELAYEFAVKYQYPDINWRAEMTEQFGFWTEKNARNILKKIGFEVTYLKKYLLDYFKKMFSEDFELFEWRNNQLTRTRYFDTHLVIAARPQNVSV